MAAFEAERARFEAANAQVLGISVDSVFSHRAFSEQLGGLSFPLLADFHPKGEVIKRYGLWREDRGDGKRAVFIIDRSGIIRWRKIYERDLPNMAELLTALAELQS